MKRYIILFFSLFCLSIFGCSASDVDFENDSIQEYSENKDMNAEINELTKESALAYIEEYVMLDEKTEVEAYEWMETKDINILHVKIQYKELQEDMYRHKEDYFIFIKDGDVFQVLPVDYSDKGIHLRYNEGTPCEGNHELGEGCSFDAHFEDVTFDGNEDLLIWVGNSRHASYYCAYVYENGIFRYERTFEHISSYQIDDQNKMIRSTDMKENGEQLELLYKFVDGKFVEIENIEG